MNANSKQRSAFTLIELLVAIGVLLFLAALGTYFLPRIKSNTAAATAGDSLQGWLLIARQRARRDQLPTGLRLLPGDRGNPLLVTQLAYIQQPEDLSIGSYIGSMDFTMPLFDFSPVGQPLTGPMDFTKLNVQPGDYLMLPEEPARRIAVVSSSITLDAATTPLNAYHSRSGYRILRSPVPLAGEQDLILPDGVAIDLGTNGIYGIAVGNPPWDIMFNARGQVVTGGAAIKYFWLRDATEEVPAGSQVFARPQQLIAILGASGFIGAFPVDTSVNPVNPLRYQDPYSFTRNPRSTGM